MREPVDWPTVDLLTHRARATPERTAVVDADADETWTVRAFDRRVDDVAAAVDGGGRIGVLMDTRPAFATVFFAAMRTGSTVVPLHARETVDALASTVDRTDPDAVVCESATEDAALEIAGRGRPVYTVDDPGNDGVEPAFRPTSTPPDPVALDRTTTQLVVFTSGTTGTPKGVRLTVGNLVASATASAFRLGVLPDDRWLCCLPMYHVGGLAPVIRSTLYGTAVVIQREFDADETARVIDEYGITGVSLVPTMLARLLDGGWSPPASLRFVLLGGAPASNDLLERCAAADVPVYPTYGTTETASQIATATPAEARSFEGTVGHPLAFTDVSVVADDGDPVDVGDPGELVVSGPTVTPGYLDEERTAAAFGDRGLHTGDVGYRDEDGRLWVLNRRSDRIVTGGENVDPGVVVDVIRDHPAVETAAVVGLPDEEWGERVAALVVPRDVAEGATVEAIRDHCRERLPGFKRPKTIGVAAELPRTPSDTVDREAVRERLLAVGGDVRADGESDGRS